jgi:hypothetical protein
LTSPSAFTPADAPPVNLRTIHLQGTSPLIAERTSRPSSDDIRRVANAAETAIDAYTMDLLPSVIGETVDACLRLMADLSADERAMAMMLLMARLDPEADAAVLPANKLT